MQDKVLQTTVKKGLKVCNNYVIKIFTRTAYKNIMLNIRVEVTQQLIRDYRNRKRGHAPQIALGTLTVFVPNGTVQDQLTCRSDAPTMDIKKV